MASFPPGNEAAIAVPSSDARIDSECLLLRCIPYRRSDAALGIWRALEAAALGAVVGGNAICNCSGKLLDRRRNLSIRWLIRG